MNVCPIQYGHRTFLRTRGSWVRILPGAPPHSSIEPVLASPRDWLFVFVRCCLSAGPHPSPNSGVGKKWPDTPSGTPQRGPFSCSSYVRVSFPPRNGIEISATRKLVRGSRVAFNTARRSLPSRGLPQVALATKVSRTTPLLFQQKLHAPPQRGMSWRGRSRYRLRRAKPSPARPRASSASVAGSGTREIVGAKLNENPTGGSVTVRTAGVMLRKGN